MQSVKQPIIRKVQVLDLAIHVQKSGLCLGDPLQLVAMTDGQIGVYTLQRRALLGLLARKPRYVGHLGPSASRIVAPLLSGAEDLRVRVVGLTPEHLASSAGPEVHVSVWGEIDEVIPPSGPDLRLQAPR